MNIRNLEYLCVPLQSIDLSDGRNRITRNAGDGLLAASVRASGVINPPVLAENESGGYRVVCGFRRLECLRASGAPSARCAVMKGAGGAEEIAASVEDNASSRRLNHAEIVAAVAALSKHFEKNEIIRRYFAAFGIQESVFTFNRYYELADLCGEALDALASGKLPLQAAEYLVRYVPERQSDFLKLITVCRMGANVLCEMAKNIFEIAVENSVPIASVFESAGFYETVADERMNPNEKSAALREKVLDMKFPEYRKRLSEFREMLKRTGVEGISVNNFPYFEKDEIGVSFTVKRPSDVAKRIGDLRKLEGSELIGEFTADE